MSRRNTSATRTLLVFILSGLLVLPLIGIAGFLLLRHQNEDVVAADINQAKRVAEAAASQVKESLYNGLVNGTATSITALTNTVAKTEVVRDPIERVLIWSPDGKLLYTSAPPSERSVPECLVPPCSAPPPLLDHTFGLSPAASKALSTGQIAAGETDGSLPQYGFPADPGRLLEVVVPVQTIGTPNFQTTSGPHEQLLFQALISSNAVQVSDRQLWNRFLPVLAIALLAFVVLPVPVAYRLARQVREVQGERELLLQRAIDASDLERRRITSDLHDGLVQEFAGLAMSLSANADAVSERDPQTGEALNEASTMVRQGMRSLRSAVMGIYPPTVHSAGLPAALSDLVAPLEAQGIRVRLNVDPGLDLPAHIEPLVFRCAQESVRNIISHAGASEVAVRLSAGRRSTVLEIVDDGSGFSATDRELAHADGHAGLRLMEDLARDARSHLRISSEPGKGTTVRLEVPR